jgi:hypothetical protein
MNNEMDRVGERYVAGITAGNRHLRLFSEVVPGGIKALVYDMTAKQVIFQELTESLREARQKCEECVRGLIGTPSRITWTHQPWLG